MTFIDSFWFTCKRCGKTFRGEVNGKPIYDDCEEGSCFRDYSLGEIHDNHYLNTIKGKRECKKCSEHVDLMTYMIITSQ